MIGRNEGITRGNARTVELADRYGISLAEDIGRQAVFGMPEHVERYGASYDFVELGYHQDDRLVANRMIAIIQPGKRTELAYWTQAAPDKQLTVHRGLGRLLLVGNSEASRADSVDLNSLEASRVIVPSGHFYVIEAAGDSDDELIVSGFYEPPLTSWDGLEHTLQPSQPWVEDPMEGTVVVPVAIHNLFSEDD